VSSDNRRFLRIPAGNANPQAVVRFEGNRTLSVEVLNKSAGGYGIGVTVDSAAAFPPGRILVIEVDDLVVQVKVAHSLLDPEEDRYLIGLERIAELEDKLAAQLPHASWYSALWPTQQGLGGQTNGLRDLVLATLFCSSLLLFTWLPNFVAQSKGKKYTRSTTSTAWFSLPWRWSAPRTYIPQIDPSAISETRTGEPAARTGNSTTPGASTPAAGASTTTSLPGANPK